MKIPKLSIFEMSFWLCGGMVLLFIVAPLLGLFLKCSAANVWQTAAEPEVRNSIFLTLWTSMAGTMIMGLLAIPFAYLLARKDFPGKNMITGLIDLPIVVPHSAAGIALLGVLTRDSWPGKIANLLGFSFVSNPAGVIAAMAFVSIPFLINGAREGFAAVPERLEKTALSLGASPARVFFTISVPLAWRSILSGLIMMWARGLSEFGAVVIIAYQPMITPILIFERFNAFGLKYARPVAAIFLLVCLLVFILLRMSAKNKSSYRAGA